MESLPQAGKRFGLFRFDGIARADNMLEPLYHQILERGATLCGCDFDPSSQSIRQINRGFHTALNIAIS